MLKSVDTKNIIWRPLLPWLQACSCTAGSSVGRGFEGRSAAAESKKEDLGAVSFKYSG